MELNHRNAILSTLWKNETQFIRYPDFTLDMHADSKLFNIWHSLGATYYYTLPSKYIQPVQDVYVQYNVNHLFSRLTLEKVSPSSVSPVIEIVRQKLWPWRHDKPMMEQPIVDTDAIISDGNSILLAWTDDVLNPYHALLDHIVKLCILSFQQGFGKKLYLISPVRPRYLCEAIEALFPDRFCIELMNKPSLLVKNSNTLLSPEPIFHCGTSLKMLNKLIANVTSSKGKYRELVYIIRGPTSKNGRTIHNEQEVSDMLQGLGFASYFTGEMSVKDQFELFAHAKVIIAPHGASLANLLACKSAPTLIELVPHDFRPMTYAYICSHLNITYFRHVYPVEPLHLKLNKSVINIEALRHCIKRVLQII